MNLIYSLPDIKNVELKHKLLIDDEKLTEILLRDIKDGKMSEELANYFLLMFEKIISGNKYKNYTENYKEEFFDKAVTHFLRYWKKFDLSKTQTKENQPPKGAYNFITTIIITSIHLSLKKLHRRQNIMKNLINEKEKNKIETLKYGIFGEKENCYDDINIYEKKNNIDDWIC
jgi:hypothetical protein